MPKLKRFVYAPDPHGEHVDRKAWEVLMAFTKDFKPHRRILGGDVFDFSPFRKGASASEKEASMERDVEAGLGLIHDFRPTDWCEGNHDIRPERVAKEETGPLGDYARRVVKQKDDIKDRYKINSTPYTAKSFIRVGPLWKAMHGNVVALHSAHWLAVHYGCVIAGHTHTIGHAIAPAIDEREAHVCGCLCEIWQPYNETRVATLRHRHGFGSGFYSEDSPVFFFNQARKDALGRWVLPSTFKEYA